VVKENLDTSGIKTLPHPPCCPGLAHSDFGLNPVTNERLVGRRFECQEAVGSAVFQSRNMTIKQRLLNEL
jgi:hypothetical protein